MAEEGAEGRGEGQAEAVKGGEKKAGRGVFRRAKTIGLIVLIVLVVIVAFQNMGKPYPTLNVLFWSATMPLAPMLLLAFVLGGLAGAGGLMMRLKRK